MAAAVTDKLLEVGSPGTATTLSAPGYTAGATSITIGSTANWPTATAVVFAIDEAEVVNGVEVQVAGTYNEFIGIVSSGTSVTSVDWVLGSGDRDYAAGSLTRVYVPVSAERENRIVTWGLTHADQDGTLKAGAVDGAGVLASNVVTYPKLESDLQGGWNSTSALPAITAVSANGNRSYTLTHASSVASQVPPGMRRRFTRTVAAPNTAFSLDGSNDYYNKTSPSGMTFTDDFVVSAWVYMTSYGTDLNGQTIISRYNGTSGFVLRIGALGAADGRVQLMGMNGGSSNYSTVVSYQSIPLNKWVHVAAQLDMDTFTATTTTSYIMIDGKNVPAFVQRGGSNPTSLVQAGNLELGSQNGGTIGYFTGYSDQVAIYSAKVTQATILASISQKLTGSETSLVSAYSNGSTTDLSANANNLSAQNGATTANKSPFGNNGVSTTLEYGLTMSVSSDGLTEVVQFPEGSCVPTTGGISASAYSTMANPYGFVSDKGRWEVKTQYLSQIQTSFPAINTWSSVIGANQHFVPTGSWTSTANGTVILSSTVAGIRNGVFAFTQYANLTNNVYKRPWMQQLYTSYADAAKIDTINISLRETYSTGTWLCVYASILNATGTEDWKLASNECQFNITSVPSGL